MPTALGGGLPAETPAHCQSCQTVSLPDFYKNPRPCCPLPNTLLRQYLWGPWACAKRRRLFSTIYGQEPGSPSPITRLGSQGSCYSLGLTPRISASKPASGRGPGGGGQGSRQMLPGAPSVLSSELCHGGNWAWLAHQSLQEPGAEGMNDQQPAEVVKSRIFPSQHHQDQELRFIWHGTACQLRHEMRRNQRENELKDVLLECGQWE
nr:RNA-binding protein 38 isoform X3 [Manis javanica]